MDLLSAGRRPVDRVLARAPWRLRQASWIVLGLTLAGAILRVYLLGDKSIWLDEAFSIALSQHELAELLRLTVQADAHPPLYYIVLKGWMVWGQSEGAVRLLSAFFSTASIPLMYLLGVDLYGERSAGLLGATILALSPFHIWYAQEARMYAMLTFLVLASAVFFVRAMKDNARRDWAGYALTTALALYTDNGALWYVVAVVCFSVLSRKRLAARGRAWFVSHAAIFVLYAPWIPSLYRQTQQVTEQFWLAPPSYHTVLETILAFNSFNFPVVGLSILYVTVVFVWVALTPGGGWQKRLAAMWLLVPVLVSLLLSLRQPIFLSRNLIVASLGYYFLIVDTIRKFNSRRATIVLLAPLLLMNVVSIGVNAWIEEKEDWRGVVQRVATHIESSARGAGEDLILFVPSYAELPFAYYFRDYDLAVDSQGYPQDELLLHDDVQEADDLDALLAGRSRVWLVLRDVETVDPQWTVKARLDSSGFVRGPTFEADEISTLTYVRWDLVDDGSRLTPPVAANKTYVVYAPVVRHEPIITEAPTPAPVVHVVARGDTLWEIARDYGVSVGEIMEANGIGNANRLSVGQQLLIPVRE